jgi:DNA-binding transcriptional LysR family regulator
LIIRVKSLKIESLRNFIKITEYQNFSKLAEDLSISQSTLSHRISQLEEELDDIVLIDRTTKKFELTKEGEIFLDYAKKIVELYDTCKNELINSSQKPFENIMITASTLPGSHILPKYIARFKEKNPSVNFKVLINNSKKSMDLLLKNMVDFAGIGSFMDIEKDKFDFVKIGEDSLRFISSPNHQLLKNDKAVVKFTDLIQFPFISREKGSGTRNIFETHFPNYNELNVELEINDNNSIISAVSDSNYISIQSELIAKKAEAAGLIKVIKIKEFPVIAQRDIYVLKVKEKEELSTLKKKFWESLKG